MSFSTNIFFLRLNWRLLLKHGEAHQFQHYVQHLLSCPKFSITSQLNQPRASALFSVLVSVGVDGERHFEAAQLFALVTQDSLNPVVTVGEPVGQIHVGQVEV